MHADVPHRLRNGSTFFPAAEAYIRVAILIGASHRAIALSWTCLAFVGVGCAGLGDNFREPNVQLDHAVIRGIGLAGGNLDLIVTIQNPNNFVLHADKLQVGIDVEQSHLGDITYEEDFSVTQNGETTLTLPLRFGWFGVGSAVWAALGYGDLPYTMKGQATLKLPGGAHTVVSFTHEGRAPLTRPSSSAGST